MWLLLLWLLLFLLEAYDDDDGTVTWPGAVGGAVAGRRDDGWTNMPLAPTLMEVVMSSRLVGKVRGLTMSVDLIIPMFTDQTREREGELPG